jgi:hypothetical protein
MMLLLLSLAGTVIAAVVGTFWYSNATPMGKIHMQSLGFVQLSEAECKKKMEEAKPMMPKLYGAQMGLSFLTSFFVVFVVTESIQNGVPATMAIAFPVFSWLCFTVPTVGSALLWSNCDRKIVWQKFFSDIGCPLVTVLLIAGMASVFA